MDLTVLCYAVGEVMLWAGNPGRVVSRRVVSCSAVAACYCFGRQGPTLVRLDGDKTEEGLGFNTCHVQLTQVFVNILQCGFTLYIHSVFHPTTNTFQFYIDNIIPVIHFNFMSNTFFLWSELIKRLKHLWRDLNMTKVDLSDLNNFFNYRFSLCHLSYGVVD